MIFFKEGVSKIVPDHEQVKHVSAKYGLAETCTILLSDQALSEKIFGCREAPSGFAPGEGESKEFAILTLYLQ